MKPNLRISGINEDWDVETLHRNNNRRFSNLQNEMDIQIQEAFRTPNRQDHKEIVVYLYIGYIVPWL